MVPIRFPTNRTEILVGLKDYKLWSDTISKKDLVKRDKDHILYLNVSGESKEIQMEGNSRSIIFDKNYKGNFTITPYEPEFIEF